jgi:leader peptidase (prepilin peptidase)/N-methyltransferase
MKLKDDRTDPMDHKDRTIRISRPEIICIGLLAVLAVPLFFVSDRIYDTDLTKTLRLVSAYLFLVPAAFIDYKLRIIPNRLLPIGIAVALVFILVESISETDNVPGRLFSSFAGLLFGGGVFALAALLSRGGVGMGDVKLFGVLGFMLEVRAVFSLIFFTLLCAAVYCVYMLASKKADMKTRVAAAPFALAGMAAAIIAGG